MATKVSKYALKKNKKNKDEELPVEVSQAVEDSSPSKLKKSSIKKERKSKKKVDKITFVSPQEEVNKTIKLLVIVSVRLGDNNIGIVSRSGSIYHVISNDKNSTVNMTAGALSKILEDHNISYKEFQNIFWKHIPVIHNDKQKNN